MTKLYDLIVVGAGPAGLLAAKAAAENGLTVALLERKKDPTKMTRACAQSLISMNEYYMGNLCNFNARDRRICFSSDGFSFGYSGPYRDAYNLEIRTPKDHPVEFGDYEVQRSKGIGGRVGVIFDKEILFQDLLGELESLSVDVISGVPVNNATAKADRVIVEGAGKSWEAAYVIAADGANSAVTGAIGLNREREYYCNIHAISHYLSNVQGLRPDQVVRTSAFAAGGAVRCYVLPRPYEGGYNMITISIDPRVDMKAAADYFMYQGVSKQWLNQAKIERTFTAVASCFSTLEVPYLDRVLSVGDACATQELEITGAMMSGWKAGHAVATAVQENRVGMETSGITQYVDWWQAAFTKRYGTGEAYMKGNMFPYLVTSADDISYFYGLIKEPLPPTWNPYSSATGSAMSSVFTTLERDRPDLLAQMKRRSLPAREIIGEITKISKPLIGED
jgi:digeranylgeranylglycerophospholipid reductase